MRNVSNGQTSKPQTSVDRETDGKVRVVRPCKSEHTLHAPCKAASSPTRPTLRRRDTLPALRQVDNRTKTKTKQNKLTSPNGGPYPSPSSDDQISRSSTPKASSQSKKRIFIRPTPWRRDNLDDNHRGSQVTNKPRAENTLWPTKPSPCSPNSRLCPRHSMSDALLPQGSKVGEVPEGLTFQQAKVNVKPMKRTVKVLSEVMGASESLEPSNQSRQQPAGSDSFASSPMTPADLSSERCNIPTHNGSQYSVHRCKNALDGMPQRLPQLNAGPSTACKRWVSLLRIQGLDMGLHQPVDFARPFKQHFPPSVQYDPSVPFTHMEISRPIEPIHTTTTWMKMTPDSAKELYRIHRAFITSIEQLLEDQLSCLYHDLQYGQRYEKPELEKPFTALIQKHVRIHRQDLINLLMLKLHGVQPQDDFTILPTGLLALYLATTECFYDYAGNDPNHLCMTLRTYFNKAKPLSETYIEAAWTPDSVFFNIINMQPREYQEVVIVPCYQCNSPFRSDSPPHFVRYSTDAPWLVWYEDSHCFKGVVPCFSRYFEQHEQCSKDEEGTISYPLDISIEAVLFKGLSGHGDSSLWFERAVRTNIHFTVVPLYKCSNFGSAMNSFPFERTISESRSSPSPTVLNSAYGTVNRYSRMRFNTLDCTHTLTQSQFAEHRAAHRSKSTNIVLMDVARKHAFLAERLSDLALQHAEAEKLCLELCIPLPEDSMHRPDARRAVDSIPTEYDAPIIRSQSSNDGELDRARLVRGEKNVIPGEPIDTFRKYQSHSVSVDSLKTSLPDLEPRATLDEYQKDLSGGVLPSTLSKEIIQSSSNSTSTSHGGNGSAIPEISPHTAANAEKELSEDQRDARPSSRSLAHQMEANTAESHTRKGSRDTIGNEGKLSNDCTEIQHGKSTDLHPSTTAKMNDLSCPRPISKPLKAFSEPLTLRNKAAKRSRLTRRSLIHLIEEAPVQVTAPSANSLSTSLKLEHSPKKAPSLPHDNSITDSNPSTTNELDPTNSWTKTSVHVPFYNSFAPLGPYIEGSTSVSDATDDSNRGRRRPQSVLGTQFSSSPSRLPTYEFASPREIVQCISPAGSNRAVQEFEISNPSSQSQDTYLTPQTSTIEKLSAACKSDLNPHTKAGGNRSLANVGDQASVHLLDSMLTSIGSSQLEFNDQFGMGKRSHTHSHISDSQSSSFHFENLCMEDGRTFSEQLKDLILAGIDRHEQGMIWDSMQRIDRSSKGEDAVDNSGTEPKLSQDEMREFDEAKKRSLEDETTRKMAACGVPDTLDDIFLDENVTTDQETLDQSEESVPETEDDRSEIAAKDDGEIDGSEPSQ